MYTVFITIFLSFIFFILFICVGCFCQLIYYILSNKEDNNDFEDGKFIPLATCIILLALCFYGIYAVINRIYFFVN